MSAPSTPLTSSEAVLWMIERDPVLRSTIVAVAVLRHSPDLARLRERLASAVEAFPRLAQRVAPATVGVPHWVDAAGFDLDHHLTHVRLPNPGSTRQLLDFAAEQAGEAFDPARPLWHLTVVDGLGRGRAAVVMKLHHAVTDGVGGVGLLPIFTDLEPEPARGARGKRRSVRRPPPQPAPSSAQQVASLATAAVGAVQDVARHPAAAVSVVPKSARSTARLLAPATRSLSPVTTGRGLDRRFEVVDLELDALAAAGKAVGGTVNDAFLAAVAGGLQRYHRQHGEVVSDLRVTMPINLRSSVDEPGGNRFTPARFAVPVSIEDPAARMEALGRIARGWRHDPGIGVSDVLAGLLSHLPGQVTTSVFGSMLKGVDFVATNVPGSPERRWLAGAEVLRFYGFGPTSGAAVSFALLSYAGACGIGINADTVAVPDAAVLRECLEQGIAEVVAVGRLGAEPGPAGTAPARGRGRRPVAPEPLSALDTSFLEAETPQTPMHVGALLLLDGAPLLDGRGRVRLAALQAEITARLDRCPRLRQRLGSGPDGRYLWEDDPAFDITNHVQRVRLVRPGDRTQLARLCCTLQMQRLDRSRPLWEMWFVDGLADGTVALVYKVHHAAVDGVSAAATFELLLAPQGQGPDGDDLGAREPAHGGGLALPGWWNDARRAARWWAATSADALRRPGLALGRAKGLAHLVSPSSLRPPSSLNRPVGAERLLLSETFALADLKAIGRRHEATVNDVVLTLVGGGLSRLLSSRGERPHRMQVLMPVSLRRPGESEGADGAPGNRVAALLLPLRIDAADVVEALRTVSASTTVSKAGPDAAALGLLLGWSDTWPAGLLGAASRQIVHHQPFANLVVTNVRGTDRPLELLGARVREIVPIVPLGGNLTLGVAVLSYAGNLVMGIHGDAEACPDLPLFADGVRDAFELLKARSA